MNCKNCNEIVQDQYCGHCGQNSNVGKITLSHLLSEISDNFFQVNKGFFYTIKELLIRPGYAINEYLNGRRKVYFKPITYVLTLSTLYFLISQVVDQNTWMEDVITGWEAGASAEDNSRLPFFLIWFSKNFAYSTLLLLPIFSFATYLSFSRFKITYLEHLVINSFVTGQQAIVYSIFIVIGTFIDSELTETIPFLITFSYTIWVFRQLFDQGNRVVNILRSSLAYVLYLILCIVISFLIMGIALFLEK